MATLDSIDSSNSTALQIEGHTLLSKLGEGATACVYAASRLSDNKRVALKVMHAGLARHEDVRRRMVAEVETSALLNHPNIVRLHGLIRSPQKEGSIISMDLIDGSSLSDFQVRLPYILPELSVLILIDILSALEHAHEKGVIHRDLKPSNILISNSGQVFITDFGLARIAEAPTITMAGTILGSPDYMSPEQARGDVITHRSDLFSAAAILYFLVTGTRPFGKASPLATVVAVANAEFEAPQKRNPKVSGNLSRIIHKALSRNPDHRYQNATEFKLALQCYLKSLGLVSSSFQLTNWLSSPSETTMTALKIIAESLHKNCEDLLHKGQTQEALESIAHLSLVAPDSESLTFLMNKISEASETLENQKLPHNSGRSVESKERNSKLFRNLGLLSIPTLIVIGVLLNRHKDSQPPLPRSEPVSSVMKLQTEVQTPNQVIKQIYPKSPKAKASPILISQFKDIKKPAQGIIQFSVPDNIRVLIDGEKVDTKQSYRTTIGKHKIVLEKTGFPPIVQVINVDEQEPTEIRVAE